MKSTQKKIKKIKKIKNNNNNNLLPSFPYLQICLFELQFSNPIFFIPNSNRFDKEEAVNAQSEIIFTQMPLFYINIVD